MGNKAPSIGYSVGLSVWRDRADPVLLFPDVAREAGISADVAQFHMAEITLGGSPAEGGPLIG